MAKYDVTFDYFHGYESEQFAFYRIPKVLFTDDYFRNLSSDAKVLYGLMLDRMALSMKNRWIDEENRVYIIFSLEQVMMYMNCGRDKGMKTLAELDTKKGIGLIERVKQGFGKPDVIYVKSFVMKEKPEPVPEPEPEAFETEGEGLSSDEVGNADLSRSEKPTCRGRKNRPDEVDKTDLSRSEKPTYRGRESRSPEVGKIDPNYTYYNNTDLSDTDRSNTNLINPSERQPAKRSGRMDEMDVIHAYTAIVKENIEYDTLIQSARLGEKEYILKETKTLDGYKLDETEHKVVFEYVDDHTPVVEYTLDLTNEKLPEENQPGTPDTPNNTTSVNSPKTGDDTNIWLFVAAMVVSAGGMIVLLVKRKRK